ncbi:lysophospholipid acyltransferase 5 [Wyeomyia smithii]|uniref:lysophospholipid acyltransferase 5 n=1 Tax=Wyeomyia smithii TaxID=174621 RepID=UPI002467EEB8|nr:lysophospholipid acyltransferase 5 [Wyeomyia smithii]XP_055531139.1 lysophospholipid acyltransferase 5 [Wyeomyia smithii]XP_055531140.1 lysophospholipid acyltransferase 5 [Wyeomyia smithii]XP_055531141.1 lysophospholipid acyltransferase 5 [Wyeomyia smithii]XP_055531142.1 lysophospholipid acyltransferase 5 [Wyeomyia smithii]
MLNLVEALANLTGASAPAIRLILSVLIAYPLGAFYRNLKAAPLVKNLFIASTGLAIVVFNYGFDLYHSALAVAVTYLLNVFFATSSLLVPLSFCYHMGYLLVGYYFTTSDTYDIKWTMPHCVLVLRLIGLAFDISDSHEKERQGKKDDRCIDPPSLLELVAFTYFPASVLVGPQFSMLRYRRFIDGLYEQHTTGAPAYSAKKFLQGTFYLIVNQVGSQLVSDTYLLSADFEQESLLMKHIYLGLWGRCALYKYISIWLLAEGAAVLFGLTYIDAKPGEREYDSDQLSGCTNIKVGVFENTSKFGHYVESFNVQTNHWTAVYVYKRLKFLNNRVLSHFGALLFLAVWHGFHSGYYVTFFMEFSVIRMEKEIEPILQKNDYVQVLLQQPLVKVAVFVLLKFYTMVFAGWCLVPFVFLSFSKWWHIYCAVRHTGSLLFLLGNLAAKPLLLAVLPPNKPSGASSESKKTE